MMEMRWLCYTIQQWAEIGYGRHAPGIKSGEFIYVLQFRDGVTHDAPWQDVPFSDVEPAIKPVPK